MRSMLPSQITGARLSFEEPVWPLLSPSCKQLVRELLRADPKERISAEEVLRHRWLTDGLENDKTLQSSLAYLQEFRAREIRTCAMKVLSNSLTDEAVAEVRAIFMLLDVDGKGYLTHGKPPPSGSNTVKPACSALLPHLLPHPPPSPSSLTRAAS